MIVVTANGARTRSLGIVDDVPVIIGKIEIPTSFQVLESRDEILILGNDWLRNSNANMDWEKSTLTIRKDRTTIRILITFTKTLKVITHDVSEEISEDEYEEECLEEMLIYFSDSSEEDSANQGELEFNPWINFYSPESSEAKTEDDDDIDSINVNKNPAIFLAKTVQDEPTPTNQTGPLDHHQQGHFQALLNNHTDICAKSQTRIRRTNLIKHQTLTAAAAPIAQTPYRTNPQTREFLRNEIIKMEEQGIVQKSSSPWASPVVIVDKKDDDKRICIDYRKLNTITKADAYPLPRINDLLESFGAAQWFTTLDLASGYWQVVMDEAEIEKTAFIIPFGLYEFLVMPFELSYALGTFQRLMNKVLQDFLGDFVAVYLDDIIIYSKGSFEMHMDKYSKLFGMQT
jgi:hypothetical protein